MKKEKKYVISYCVQSFMLNEMELTSSELIIFAIIYSFTNGEHGVYYGTKELLSCASKLSVSTVKRVLLSLMSKKYVEECRYKKRLAYRAVPIEKEKASDGVPIIERKRADTEDEDNDIIRPKYIYHALGRLGIVQMTREQHKKLLTLIQPEHLQTYVRKLEILITDKNYKSFNHYRTIKTWITEDTAV